MSRQQPLLVIYEDVHWLDPSSRELLDMTVELPPMINLAQYSIEQFLLDAAEARIDLIGIRWQNRLAAIDLREDGARLTVETPDGGYTMEARLGGCGRWRPRLPAGIDDADNLAWKLAFVVKGLPSEKLLDSYSAERVAATHENLSYGAKSTEFMAPPSLAFELMRKAVLSLAVKRPFLNSLINPRQTSAITYATSPLNAADRSDDFTTGPVPGQPLPECPVTIVENGAAREAHLTDLVTPGITAFYFSGDGAIPTALSKIEADMRAKGIPFALVNLTRHLNPGATEKHGWDHTGRLFDMYNATPDSLYFVRPDGHVLGRWRRFDANATMAAIDLMLHP